MLLSRIEARKLKTRSFVAFDDRYDAREQVATNFSHTSLTLVCASLFLHFSRPLSPILLLHIISKTQCHQGLYISIEHLQSISRFSGFHIARPALPQDERHTRATTELKLRFGKPRTLFKSVAGMHNMTRSAPTKITKYMCCGMLYNKPCWS